MTIQLQLQRQQVIIGEATAIVELLKKLPSDLAVATVLKLHGGWHLSVSSGTTAALAALRPLAMEVRRDSWDQPSATVQDRRAADGDLCFPVGFQGGDRVFWYSELGDGTRLKVVAPREDLVIPRGYTLVNGAHIQFYRRAYTFAPLAPVRDIVGDEAAERASKAAAAELEKLFQGPLAKRRNKVDVEVLGVLLTARMGYPVTVSERGASPRGSDCLVYSFWVSVGRWHEDLTLTLSAVRDADGYDFEYPENAQYGEATPLFAALS